MDDLSKFLAAPETLLKSETEKRKALHRRAREDARKEQLRRSKLKTKPTVEDMLADLIRCAEDRETNKFWETRTISRKHYELYGHFPLDHVIAEFGQFNHALEVAGLRDKPGTRLWMANRAITSRRQHAARYLTRYVRPYVIEQDVPVRDATVILSISDTHATFLDPFTWVCFLQAISDLKPDVVYFNGDILEGSEISRHPKSGWSIPLQMEFDFAREMFRQARERTDGMIVWGSGNHGLDRLASYLTQVATGVSSLRDLRFDKLAGLGELDIKLCQGGTLASPEGEEEYKSGMLFGGFYRIHHGTCLGQTPALSELRSAGRSGQSGHVHRAMVAYGTNEKEAGMSWMSTPMGCTDRAGRAYVRGINSGWQKGFGIAFLYPDGDVHQYPVVTDRDRCSIEGYVYRRPKNLPDPDPMQNWLAEWTP